MRGRRSHNDGVTLFEIMVALAVVGLMAVALAVGYQRLPSTALKKDAAKLASAMRSTFDRATATGAHHRMIVDLDEQTYRVEKCEGKVEMRKAQNVKAELEAAKDEKEKREEEARGMANPETLTPEQAMQREMMAGAQGQAVGGAGGRSGAACGPVKGLFGTETKFNAHPEVTLNKVWVSHLEQPAAEGMVTINFFPQGYAERAVLELNAGDDDVMSIALSPMSGRVQIVSGIWRDADDFTSRDAEGKEITPQ